MKKYQLSIAFSIFLVSGLLGCSRSSHQEASTKSEASGLLVIVDSEEGFHALVNQSEVPVLVDFWATWCPPCRAMEPVIASAAQRHQNKLSVAKVDVDKNRALSEKFNIRAIPTLMVFHGGQAIAVHEGALLGDARLDQWLNEQLKQSGVTL